MTIRTAMNYTGVDPYAENRDLRCRSTTISVQARLYHGPTQRKFGHFRHALGVTAFRHFE
jgi:hypothetical protein